jgi:hypothetical protein
MQAFEAESAGAAPNDDKSSVANRSTKAYFFRSLRISFRAACLPGIQYDAIRVSFARKFDVGKELSDVRISGDVCLSR